MDVDPAGPAVAGAQGVAHLRLSALPDGFGQPDGAHEPARDASQEVGAGSPPQLDHAHYMHPRQMEAQRAARQEVAVDAGVACLLYTSPSPRD